MQAQCRIQIIFCKLKVNSSWPLVNTSAGENALRNVFILKLLGNINNVFNYVMRMLSKVTISARGGSRLWDANYPTIKTSSWMQQWRTVLIVMILMMMLMIKQRPIIAKERRFKICKLCCASDTNTLAMTLCILVLVASRDQRRSLVTSRNHSTASWSWLMNNSCDWSDCFDQLCNNLAVTKG